MFTSGSEGKEKQYWATRSQFAAERENYRHIMSAARPEVLTTGTRVGIIGSTYWSAAFFGQLSLCSALDAEPVMLGSMSDATDNIDILGVTPSMLHLLQPKLLEGLKVLILWGSGPNADDVEYAKRMAPLATIVDLLLATEYW